MALPCESGWFVAIPWTLKSLACHKPCHKPRYFWSVIYARHFTLSSSHYRHACPVLLCGRFTWYWRSKFIAICDSCSLMWGAESSTHPCLVQMEWKKGSDQISGILITWSHQVWRHDWTAELPMHQWTSTPYGCWRWGSRILFFKKCRNHKEFWV